MKRTRINRWSLGVFIATILTGASLQAQTPNRLAAAVQEQQLNQEAIRYHLFETATQKDVMVDREINNVTYLKLDKQALRALRNAGNSLISFQLPVKDLDQAFTLYNFNILDDGFKVYERGSDGQKREVKIATGAFYRGILSGQTNSIAAFTFTGDEVAGVFSTPEDGNYNLVLNYNDPGIERDQYILFREADIKSDRRPKCSVTETMEEIAPREEVIAAKGVFSNCRKVRVSMQADYKLFQKRGSNTASAAEYLANLFNMISVLYANDGVNAVMSETVVNSAPDGYTYGASEDLLFKFGEKMQSGFTGDIAHLVSGYDEGGAPVLGGFAWIDVLCATPQQINYPGYGMIWWGPYGICNNLILNNIPQVPIYSWDVEASTHEIGHNLGSRHTHSCSWPGGPIDNCVPPEGACAPGPAPDPSGGTIMSYCHITPVGVNLALGFGPLPRERIHLAVNYWPCLSTTPPQQTLTQASKIRVANRQCSDADWTSYYYNNNTGTESDDELLLMIKSMGQNIGNVDTPGLEVKMTTQAYGSGTGRSVTAPYAASDWREANRTWSVTLPAGLQPTATVTIRFPFMNQDVQDIKGSIPALSDATQLSVMTFNNQSAASNPATAPASGVNYYTNAAIADTMHWQLGTMGSYSYAEFASSYGIFGGSMGFRGVLGIDDLREAGQSLGIYPNPASSQLNITIPKGVKSSGQELTVFDQLGRAVLQRKYTVVAGNVLKLNIAGLPAGIYNIRCISDGSAFHARFIKK